MPAPCSWGGCWHVLLQTSQSGSRTLGQRLTRCSNNKCAGQVGCLNALFSLSLSVSLSLSLSLSFSLAVAFAPASLPANCDPICSHMPQTEALSDVIWSTALNYQHALPAAAKWVRMEGYRFQERAPAFSWVRRSSRQCLTFKPNQGQCDGSVEQDRSLKKTKKNTGCASTRVSEQLLYCPFLWFDRGKTACRLRRAWRFRWHRLRQIAALKAVAKFTSYAPDACEPGAPKCTLGLKAEFGFGQDAFVWRSSRDRQWSGGFNFQINISNCAITLHRIRADGRQQEVRCQACWKVEMPIMRERGAAGKCCDRCHSSANGIQFKV